MSSLEQTLYLSRERCDEVRGQGDYAIARRGGQHSQAGALPDALAAATARTTSEEERASET